MVIKCIKRFRDLESDTFREVGDTFEATNDRYKSINTAGYGQLVEKVRKSPSDGVSEPQKTTQTKTTRRRGRPRKTAEAEQ